MSEWQDNTKRYLFGIGLLEEAYKLKKISFKQKKEIQKRLDKAYHINYWKLNPNLKEPLLKAIFNRMVNTYEIIDSPSNENTEKKDE